MERSGVTDRSPRARMSTLWGRWSSSPGERTVSGGHGGGETRVPIPNTAVKPASADGTWGVAPWESRTPPGFLQTTPLARRGVLSRVRPAGAPVDAVCRADVGDVGPSDVEVGDDVAKSQVRTVLVPMPGRRWSRVGRRRSHFRCARDLS